MSFRRLLTVPFTACLVVACADDAPDRAAVDPATRVVTSVNTATIRIERSRFSDAEITVAPGTTVVFVNDDAFAHTVTSRDGAPVEFESGELGKGDTFAIDVDRPGTYRYFCRIHPTMRAAVVVG